MLVDYLNRPQLYYEACILSAIVAIPVVCIIRPHCMRSTIMRPIATDGVVWSVCLLVKPCKNRCTDQDTDWDADSSGPKEQYIRWWCTLAPPSEYGGLTFSVVAMRPVAFITIATFSLLASCDLSVLPSSALLYGGKVIGPTPEAATQGFVEWWHTACDSDFIEHIDYNMTSCWSADFALANLRFFRGGGWLWEPEQVKQASIAGSGLMGELNLSICELGHGHD